MVEGKEKATRLYFNTNLKKEKASMIIGSSLTNFFKLPLQNSPQFQILQ